MALLFYDLKFHALTVELSMIKFFSSYGVASGSEIMLCNKINKPLVVYRFSGSIMTSIKLLHT